MFLINTSIKCLVLDHKIRHPHHLHQEEEHGSYMSKYFKIKYATANILKNPIGGMKDKVKRIFHKIEQITKINNRKE